MIAWEKFKKFVIKNSIIEPMDRILIAVSGGPDSICLMHLLWRLKKIMHLDLSVVTIDHSLRKSSKKDIKLVKKTAEKLDIKVIVEKVKVKEFSKKQKMSIETAGRSLRYEKLVSIAEKKHYNKIATGHNANDNVETMLMWLVRGTGLAGLSGVPIVRKINKKISIIRPILPLKRKEIMSYLHKQRLSFAVDKTNCSMEFTRNRIRHKLMPGFEKLNPRFIDHVFNLSQIISLENEFLQKTVSKIMGKITRKYPSKIELDLKGFFRYNKAVQLRVLKNLLPERISVAHIEHLRDWMLVPKNSQKHLFNRWIVSKTDKKLTLKSEKKDIKW